MKGPKIDNITLNAYVILSVLTIILLVSVFMYLEKLKTCPCYIQSQKNKNVRVDTNFLQAYQVLEILSLVVLLSSIYMYRFAGGKKNKESSQTLMFFMIISGLVFTLINMYLSYNTYLFYQVNDQNCKCVNKWQRFYLYIQGIFGGINAVRGVTTGLLLVVFALASLF